jgi:acyl-CoA hydrolase
LPEKERARAMVEITRGIPPRYKDAIESYFRKLETGDAGR